MSSGYSMKKNKKPQQKAKEFATTPFRSLKGVVATGNPLQEPPPPKRPAAPEADEDACFLRAMGDVRRLGVPAKEGVRPERPTTAIPRRIDEEERLIFLNALENLQLDVTFVDELPDDVEPLKPLPVNRMRQLKKGVIRIDYELDLHGLTRDEALTSLGSFISGAYRRGQRAVLVITGKGLNSPEEPVLRGAVIGWLRDKGKGMVAEFSPAPRQMGGGGALVVFLKEKKEQPEEK